jgi:hypothetical protein
MGGKKRNSFRSHIIDGQETHPSANGWPKRKKKKNLDRMREKKRRPTEWQMQKEKNNN